MSGHSKWKTIKHKKSVTDARRGKIFTRLAREITIAAHEGGGDPDEDAVVKLAFISVSLPWICLGFLDEDERLTALGAWALPRGLARAWGAEFDPEPSG